MRLLSHAPFLAVLFALLAVLIPASASAAEVRQGDRIVVAPGETIDDNLYVFGGSANVQGTVNGDVVFFGGTSTISGLITGDVLVLGGSTTIGGDVRGSVRAAGGTITIAGNVGQDVALAGGTLDVAPSARLGRDLLAGVGSAQISAPIGRNVIIGSGDVTLTGPIGGNVRADAGTLRLLPGAAVKGKLSYASERPAEIACGVVVGGGIERGDIAYGRDIWAPSGSRIGFVPATGALLWSRGLVGMFLLGLVLVLLSPGVTRGGSAALSTNFGSTLLFGVALLIGVPILAFLVFAFGLLIGGWWLGVALLFLYSLALGLGYVISSVLVGDWILQQIFRRKTHAVWSLSLGILGLGVLALIPVAGAIVSGTAVTAGLGALGAIAMNGYRAQKQSTVAQIAIAKVGTAPSPA